MIVGRSALTILFTRPHSTMWSGMTITPLGFLACSLLTNPSTAASSWRGSGSKLTRTFNSSPNFPISDRHLATNPSWALFSQDVPGQPSQYLSLGRRKTTETSGQSSGFSGRDNCADSAAVAARSRKPPTIVLPAAINNSRRVRPPHACEQIP